MSQTSKQSGSHRGTDVLVRLDPRFAPEHAAYYLRGVMQHTGSTALPLSRNGFPDAYFENKPLALVLNRAGVERNIYIAADDMVEVDPAGLEWAHIYGKVNLQPDLVPGEHAHKMVPIGPSHALKIWNLRESLRTATRTAQAGGRLLSTRAHYRQYWLQYTRRVGDAQYEPGQSEDRYVFYNSWLWAKHSDVNPPRAEFIRICRRLGNLMEFEGGFIARRRNDVPEYADLLAERRYPLPEYLRNIKRSTLVFNNPAVHGCLGWKLAEFLRLGKAIVSLPLTRELPSPLVHGEHIHYVDGSPESLEEGIRTVVGDPDYRHHLERSARTYYLEHLAPAIVIGRLAALAFGDQRADQPTGA